MTLLDQLVEAADAKRKTPNDCGCGDCNFSALMMLTDDEIREVVSGNEVAELKAQIKELEKALVDSQEQRRKDHLPDVLPG